MGPPDSFRFGTLLIVSMTIFILVIDATTIEVSINTLVKDLNTDVSSIQTIFTIFTLKALLFNWSKTSDSSGGRRPSWLVFRYMEVGIFTAAVSQNATMPLWLVYPGRDSSHAASGNIDIHYGDIGKTDHLPLGSGAGATAASIFGLIFGGSDYHYSWRWGFATN